MSFARSGGPGGQNVNKGLFPFFFFFIYMVLTSFFCIIFCDFVFCYLLLLVSVNELSEYQGGYALQC